MKNKFILLLCLLIFIISTTLSINENAILMTNTTLSTSKVRISVFDEQNQPIDMATIYIVETHEYYSTAKLGQLELSLETTSKNNIFKKENWQEYTLLIYKNGYIPHVLYGLKAIPKINRTGIVVTLKDTSHNTNIPFTQSYDFPSDDYSTNIINNHKK